MFRVARRERRMTWTLLASVMLTSACAGNTYMGIPLAPGRTNVELQRTAILAKNGDKEAQLELAARFESGDGVPRSAVKSARLKYNALSPKSGVAAIFVPQANGSIMRTPVYVGPEGPGGDTREATVATIIEAGQPAFEVKAQRAITSFRGLLAEAVQDVVKYEYFHDKCLLNRQVNFRRFRETDVGPGGKYSYLPGEDGQTEPDLSEGDIQEIRQCFSQSALPEDCSSYPRAMNRVANLIAKNDDLIILRSVMSEVRRYCGIDKKKYDSNPQPQPKSDTIVDELLRQEGQVYSGRNGRARAYSYYICRYIIFPSSYNIEQSPPLDFDESFFGRRDGSRSEISISPADILLCSATVKKNERLTRLLQQALKATEIEKRQ